VFVAGCALLCAPWFIKNAVATGNPTYPLLSNLFGNPVWSTDQIARWNAAHNPPGFGLAEVTASLAELGWKSEWTSVALVPLLIAGVCLGWKRREIRWLGGYLAFFVAAWWLFTHRIDRFWLPAVPLAALVGASAIDHGQTWRRVVSLTSL